MIAADLVKNGWEGLVMFAYVRDKAALAGLNIGVKALGSIPKRSFKRAEGQVNIPIEIGGLVCHPGDRIYADEDGVIIVNENIPGK
jgi:regulator of ribonuclease activity A